MSWLPLQPSLVRTCACFPAEAPAEAGPQKTIMVVHLPLDVDPSSKPCRDKWLAGGQPRVQQQETAPPRKAPPKKVAVPVDNDGNKDGVGGGGGGIADVSGERLETGECGDTNGETGVSGEILDSSKGSFGQDGDAAAATAGSRWCDFDAGMKRSKPRVTWAEPACIAIIHDHAAEA